MMNDSFGTRPVPCSEADCKGCDLGHVEYDGKTWVNGIRTPFWLARRIIARHQKRFHA